MSDLDPQDWEYYVLFYTDDGTCICVYCMVGFEKFPYKHDISVLIDELKTDESFGMATLINFCSVKVVDKQIGIAIMDENSKT